MSVELVGYSKTSSKIPVAAFHIALSSSHWSYHLSEITLLLTLYVLSSKKRIRERYALKMKSRTQLAAWIAELIQAQILGLGNNGFRAINMLYI